MGDLAAKVIRCAEQALDQSPLSIVPADSDSALHLSRTEMPDRKPSSTIADSREIQRLRTLLEIERTSRKDSENDVRLLRERTATQPNSTPAFASVVMTLFSRLPPCKGWGCASNSSPRRFVCGSSITVSTLPAAAGIRSLKRFT